MRRFFFKPQSKRQDALTHPAFFAESNKNDISKSGYFIILLNNPRGSNVFSCVCHPIRRI